MEEENKKNHPNLPSNYVTLLQLQQRWLKEQKSKQKEKGKQKEEENDVVLVKNQKSESGGEEKKKKKKNKKKKKKPKSEKEGKKEKNENAGVEAEPKDNDGVEAEVKENDDVEAEVKEKAGVEAEVKENAGVEAEVKETRKEKVVWRKVGDDVADRTVEIGEKLESVKVTEENEVSGREKRRYVWKNYPSNVEAGRYNGRYARRYRELRGYYGGFGRNGRFNRRDDGNQKVWVKKEHVAGVEDENLC